MDLPRGKVYHASGRRRTSPKRTVTDLPCSLPDLQAPIRFQPTDLTRNPGVFLRFDLHGFSLQGQQILPCLRNSSVPRRGRSSIREARISRRSSTRSAAWPSSASRLVAGNCSISPGGTDPSRTLIPIPITTQSTSSPDQTDSTRIPHTLRFWMRMSLGHLILASESMLSQGLCNSQRGQTHDAGEMRSFLRSGAQDRC